MENPKFSVFVHLNNLTAQVLGNGLSPPFKHLNVPFVYCTLFFLSGSTFHIVIMSLDIVLFLQIVTDVLISMSCLVLSVSMFDSINITVMLIMCFMFALQLGMAGALETLCGQTFGAEEYGKLGNYTCCAILTLTVVCFPISLVWIFTDKILIFFSQDPGMSHVAREYCIYLIPALFGYALLQALIRYFQTQGMIFPMVFSSVSALFLHIPICWILVFKLGLGHIGAALAIGISYWLNVIWLWVYIKYSPSCQKTKIVFSTHALHNLPEFCKYAIPSGLMFW